MPGRPRVTKLYRLFNARSLSYLAFSVSLRLGPYAKYHPRMTARKLEYRSCARPAYPLRSRHSHTSRPLAWSEVGTFRLVLLHIHPVSYGDSSSPTCHTPFQIDGYRSLSPKWGNQKHGVWHEPHRYCNWGMAEVVIVHFLRLATAVVHEATPLHVFLRQGEEDCRFQTEESSRPHGIRSWCLKPRYVCEETLVLCIVPTTRGFRL